MAPTSQFCLLQTSRAAPRAYDFSSYRVSQYYRADCRSNCSRQWVACQRSDNGVTRDLQKSGFSMLQLSHWRFQTLLKRSQRKVSIPLASSSGEHNNPAILNVNSFTSKAFSLSQVVPTSLSNFPWDKAYAGLNRRISNLLLILLRWIALPVLVVMAINDIIFTVSVGKELLIPIGLLAGSVLAGILTETALIISDDFQESVIQWHLLGIGVFFVVMKIAGIKCLKHLYWASAFLLHFANGGLWQTVRFAVRWKQGKAER